MSSHPTYLRLAIAHGVFFCFVPFFGMVELFDDDNQDAGQLRINETYAKRFEYNKQREERQKLSEKYGDVSDASSEESSSEDEDDHAELLTPAVDAAILQTIVSIKSHNPEIYDSKTDFFPESQFDVDVVADKTGTQTKKITLKDYQRELVLKNGGIVEDLDDDENQEHQLTHVEQQEHLKHAFKSAMGDGGGDDDDELGGFTKRELTQEEREQEEEEYKRFLLESLAVCSFVLSAFMTFQGER